MWLSLVFLLSVSRRQDSTNRAYGIQVTLYSARGQDTDTTHTHTHIEEHTHAPTLKSLRSEGETALSSAD